jgi:hypothetical protein
MTLLFIKGLLYHLGVNLLRSFQSQIIESQTSHTMPTMPQFGKPEIYKIMRNHKETHKNLKNVETSETPELVLPIKNCQKL